MRRVDVMVIDLQQLPGLDVPVLDEGVGAAAVEDLPHGVGGQGDDGANVVAEGLRTRDIGKIRHL